MNTFDLIAYGIPLLDEETEPGICCVTGESTATVAKKSAIKDSFTNLDLMRAPDSTRISAAAAAVLAHPQARFSSWLAMPGEFRLIKGKAQARELVFAPPPPPFVGYITTSFKKHGALRAPVNQGSRNAWLFETVVADCTDIPACREMYTDLRAAQDRGVPRTVLENFDAGPSLIAKLGILWWSDFSATYYARRSDPVYQFMVYLLPSQEELKCATKNTSP